MKDEARGPEVDFVQRTSPEGLGFDSVQHRHHSVILEESLRIQVKYGLASGLFGEAYDRIYARQVSIWNG